MSFDDLQFSGLNPAARMPVHCPQCFRVVDVRPMDTTCPAGHTLPQQSHNPLLSHLRPAQSSNTSASTSTNARAQQPAVDEDGNPTMIPFPALSELLASLSSMADNTGTSANNPNMSPEYIRMLMAQQGVNVDDLVQSLLNEPSYGDTPTSKGFLEALKPRKLTKNDFVQLVLRFKGVSRDIEPTAGEFGPSLASAHEVNDLTLKKHFEMKLVRTDPYNGSTINNASQFADSGSDSAAAALLTRGGVTFVDKTRNAQRAGAKAAVIVNTSDDWPYNMKDTAGTGKDITIPALMLSSKDAVMVENACEKSGSSMTVECLTRWRELSCPICLDNFSMDDEATRLPCRHTFHDQCIRDWLTKRNLCPLCRFVLPTEGKKLEEERQRQYEQQMLREGMFS